jgi:DNA replication protein DnaC
MRINAFSRAQCGCEAERIALEKLDVEVMAERQAEAERDEKINAYNRRKNSGLPEMAQSQTLNNFRRLNKSLAAACNSAIAYISAFDEHKFQGNGLYIWGQCGTGKTHLAYAIANALLERKVNVKFAEIVDLLGKARSTFNGNKPSDDEYAIIGEYANAELLILDDLGSEKASEWTLQTLYAIVNARYANSRPTVITSNMALETLRKYYGDHDPVGWAGKIIGRLEQLSEIVRIDAPDYRREGRR